MPDPVGSHDVQRAADTRDNPKLGRPPNDHRDSDVVHSFLTGDLLARAQARAEAVAGTPLQPSGLLTWVKRSGSLLSITHSVLCPRRYSIGCPRRQSSADPSYPESPDESQPRKQE
jgi:hypothetical protein